MAQFSIWIVSPMKYSHSAGFMPQAIALQSGFKELGHECKIVTNYWDAPEDSTCIILGANLLSVKSYFPKNPIIFNLEQITPGSTWMTEDYIRLLRSKPVWDYSYNNIVELSKLKVRSVKYCGIGYAPELSCIPEPVNQPIDVLFYGSINDRRKEILEELAKYCDVTAKFDVYGDELNYLIGRSKVVLNMHYFDSKVFEITRCQYLLANKKAIVSEYGGDKELETPFYDGICFSDHDNLVQSCVNLLKNPDVRHMYENRGFDIFSQMKQSDFIKAALAPAQKVLDGVTMVS